MQTLDHAGIRTSDGVAGDFRGRPGKRQVTVLSARAWQLACADVGRELPWTTRRANLLVADMDLPQRAGDVLRIGDVRLLVTMEVDPCSRMDEQCAGLRAALVADWRGGVACSVLAAGEVRIGDDVSLEAAAD
ncbi:MAG: hypothetical protein U5K76_13180 [Woeseiaceae bacterium]|nr:hypothetical protein [Woeseiaceae bacterium]